MQSKILIVTKIILHYPYLTSAEILIDFCSKWDCKIFSINTKSPIAIIGIPWVKFKLLYGRNPKVGKYNVPENSTYFIESVEVIKIQI